MATEIITKLSDSLKNKLKDADEIWVAVALINLGGLNYILKSVKPSCKQNYIIGIDLPTDPKALKLLNELQLKTDLKVCIYTDKNNFHPKLYLISTNGKYSAFIGSANCTNGGLTNNIELTTFIQDQDLGIQLLEWFAKINLRSKPLTTKYVLKYQNDFQERLDRKKDEEKFTNKEKDLLNTEHEATLADKAEFIRILKQYRRSNDYTKIVAERKDNVNTLREDLDYPKYQKIDIDGYFSQWELGHLIAIAKPAIQRNMPQLKRLLKYLTNESIDIATRYDRVLNGDLKAEGISKAFISKVLTVHKPELYFVKNGKTERALKKYGIELSRGLTEGEKYKITCKFLRQVCIDTDIKDLTVLDYYLYLEGNDE
jgi:HKD family nuclease